MSQETLTVKVPEGEVRYSVYRCNNCGHETTDLDEWIRLASFFPNFFWMRQQDRPIEWETEACSMRCFRTLMADAMERFCELWEAHHS
jgi:hypothetical protein